MDGELTGVALFNTYLDYGVSVLTKAMGFISSKPLLMGIMAFGLIVGGIKVLRRFI